MNNNQLIDLRKYLGKWTDLFPSLTTQEPWIIPQLLTEILKSRIGLLNRDEYILRGTVAIHTAAHVEENVIIKGPAIISARCFIAAHAYLRGGVFLGEHVTIGPGCEVKSSVIMPNSALAHFNFVGDSLLGTSVNMEAGAVIANHYNERKEKTIAVRIDGKCFAIEALKFGALVGDFTKIGANAVLSPGTMLQPSSIVKRLALVEQCPEASA
jgi:NDP-sugar pyrophosphorylase family protein